MPTNISTTGNAAGASAGLLRGRRAIAAARSRSAIPSDGGGTGKSDGND